MKSLPLKRLLLQKKKKDLEVMPLPKKRLLLQAKLRESIERLRESMFSASSLPEEPRSLRVSRSDRDPSMSSQKVSGQASLKARRDRSWRRSR